MGLLNGTVSYLRFVAMGELGDLNEETLKDALEAHAFRDIDPNGDEERSVGWVRFDDPFSAEWAPGELIQPGGLVVLRLRIDTLKVPALTLKAYIHAAERDRLTAAARDKLTRAEKDQVKVEVRKDLRRRSLPKMALVDVLWNLSTGDVRLFSTGRAVAALFCEVFEKTMALELRSVGPMTVLWLRGLAEEDAEALSRTEPERFHLPVGSGGEA